MIVTVTPNPSVDRTFEVPQLVRGTVLRADHLRVDPGGKGINVARALSAYGRDTQAVVPVGGAEGRQLTELLERAGIEVATIPIAAPVRSNVTIVEPDGTVTKINEPGPTLRPGELATLLARTDEQAAGADWLVGSGSLPPGAPDDLFAELVRRARAAGCRTAIDTSGAPLRAALPAGPDLIKPNDIELAEAAGCGLRTLGDVVAAGRLLQRQGARTVLASLGADGAVLLTSDRAWHATAEVAHPNSSVGAGDATLAGFLAGTVDEPPTVALRRAVAFGAAAVQLPGSRMPVPADLRPDLVVVHDDLDPTRALRTPVPGPQPSPTA